MFNTRRMRKPNWYIAWLMVFLQFSMLGLILFTGPVLKQETWVLVLVVLGTMLGLWAIYTIRLGNFNISPLVKEHAEIVMKGPYKFIRHPMYTALLIVCWALVIGHFTTARMIYVITLTLALIVKLHLEEGYLKKAFQPYAAYTEKTKKLIPFIW